jgi:hypothetical protein
VSKLASKKVVFRGALKFNVMKNIIVLIFCALALIILDHNAFGQNGGYNYDLSQKMQADFNSHSTKSAKGGGDFLITLKPDSLKPYSAEDLGIQIPNSTPNIDAIIIEEGEPFIPTGGRFLRYSIKDMLPGQVFNLTIGGLEAERNYSFTIILFGKNNGLFWKTVYFKTYSDPAVGDKEVLFVIDNDLQNDSDIVNSINRYVTDLHIIYPNFSFKTYYLEDNNLARENLYDSVRQSYFNNNLNYLFFIGRNGKVDYTFSLYDTNNNIIIQYNFWTIAYYTYIYNKSVEYNEQLDLYYLNSGGNNPSRIQDSRSEELSFGILSPTKFDFPSKKAYILSYFDKLHQFRSGTIISFSNSVLYSMTMYPTDDSLVLNNLILINRFQNNQSVVTGHVYAPDYYGDDPIWQQDYLNKLNTNSYEFCMLNVHGSPSLHYFGITPTEINSLSNLNILFFLLGSCSTGNMLYEHYLAGEYLNKGNTLEVLAFNSNIGLFNNYFSQALSENTLGNYLYRSAKGEIISDAIKNTGNNADFAVLYGDPLLSYNYNNLNVSISKISGQKDTLQAVTTQPGLYNYQWFFNGNPIPGANEIKYLPSSSGSYKVWANGNNCMAESNSISYGINGISNNSDFYLINIYPNPTEGLFYISIDKSNCQTFKLTIYNLTGSIVLSRLCQGESLYCVDISSIPQGCYFVAINTGTELITRKLSVIR